MSPGKTTAKRTLQPTRDYRDTASNPGTTAPNAITPTSTTAHVTVPPAGRLVSTRAHCGGHSPPGWFGSQENRPLCPTVTSWVRQRQNPQKQAPASTSDAT